MPRPSDLVQIRGPVFRGDSAVFDDEEAAAAVAAEEEAEEEEEGVFEIPCAAHLTRGDRSIHLNCLYYSSSATLFTDNRECADETVKMADETDRVSSVGITMQDVIFCAEESGDNKETVEGEGEDVRDDNGNAFLVLHVNRGLGASARLYCKKIPNSRNGLMDGFVESLGLYKWRRETSGGVNVVGRRSQKVTVLVRDKKTRMRPISKVPVTMEGYHAQGIRKDRPMGRPRLLGGNRKCHEASE